MKSQIKKLGILVIGGIILAELTTGCANITSFGSKKRIAAELLEKKYQEQFEVLDMKDGGIFKNYYTVKAYAKDYPDLIFEASVDYDSHTISDPYVTKRLCARMSDQISKNLGSIGSNYYVFAEEMLGETDFTDPEISMLDYMQELPMSRFTIYICLAKEEADPERIKSALPGILQGISPTNGTLVFYLMDKELLNLTEAYVITHDNTYQEFEDMTDASCIGMVQFTQNNFTITPEITEKIEGL